MAKKIDDEDAREKRRERRRQAQEESKPPANGGMGSKAFTGPTGYHYGEDYHFRGGKPPAKTDYDAMTQEQRTAIGFPTWESYHQAQRDWRSGSAPGGSRTIAQGNLAESLRQGGANSWQDIMRIAGGSGYAMRPDMGQALLKRLKMAFEGSADPSGRYHFDGDGQAIDVGTSDLSKRGIPGASDFFGPRMGGMEAVFAALGGGSNEGNEGRWNQTNRVATGDWTEWPPGSGRFFNDPGNDASRRTWFDIQGRPVAPPPEGGPNIDYSMVNQSEQTLSDYLRGQGVIDQNMAQHRRDAENAPPITPGSNLVTSTPQGVAWGTSGLGSNFQPQRNRMPAQNVNFGISPTVQQPLTPRKPQRPTGGMGSRQRYTGFL